MCLRYKTTQIVPHVRHFQLLNWQKAPHNAEPFLFNLTVGENLQITHNQGEPDLKINHMGSDRFLKTIYKTLVRLRLIIKIFFRLPLFNHLVVNFSFQSMYK
jgi:hypothetical protein